MIYHLPMIIRECKKEDLQKVLVIENSSFDQPFSESLFKTFIAKFRPGFRIVESADRLIGYSIIFPHQRSDSMILMSIAIDPDYRRMKTGSALLWDAISLASNFGAKRMILQVAEDNLAARNLYTKVGFKQTQDLKDYYGKGRDGVEMERLTRR